MMLLGMIVLATLQLGGAFGEASAEVEELSSRSMILDIQVQVAVSADAVVAHLSFDNDPSVVLPLLDRGGGLFGVRTELEPKNYQVVFEAVGSPGELSDPVSLVALGASLELPAESATRVDEGGDGDEGLSMETRRLGWLAVALGAASLSALAFWALAGRGEEEASEGPTGSQIHE